MMEASWLGLSRATHGLRVLAMTKSLNRKSNASDRTMRSAPRHVLCRSRHHTATTAKGLAKKGLKQVECLRPAWYKFSSSHSGMLGVYTGDYVPFPSDIN